ncbi:MAG: ABC-F family ATP-binding cassette domain-containing protein, partial [Oscillospiraceae bacterium]|nr:ABC-F family ATP-binding cassette domain-containing protein [Oscillospiraceae bacterium]
MVDISVRDLVKSFEVGSVLLDGMSFDIHEGECVGIMGRNGCGKTTLFRLLTGEIFPDEGEIVLASGKKLGLISQIPHYPRGYTVEDVLKTAFAPLEAIRRKMEQLALKLTASAPKAWLDEYDRLSNSYLTQGGYEQDTQMDKICNGLGIPTAMRQQEFDRLSGGEKTRVNLGRLLLEKTDILLLDEPTNHLDLKSVEWLEDYILKFKGTVLTISHDRYFLDRVVYRII